MPASSLDPYARVAHLTLRNLADDWRERRGEAFFHLLAMGVGAVLLSWLALAQRDALSALLAWALREHALALSSGVFVALWLDQRAARRRQDQAWRRDWVAAQPGIEAIHSRRRRRQAMSRAIAQGMTLTTFAWFGRVPWSATSWAALFVLAAALAVSVVTPARASFAVQASPRETPFAARGRASFWRWQWTEAGASLAPQRLAWALPVLLLVPRGALIMAGVALVLVTLVAVRQAWQRSLGVIPQAQAWLATQPLAPRRWLGACLLMPILLLTLACAALAAMAAMANSPLLVLLSAVVLPMFALLQLAAVVCERARPHRAGLLWLLHAAVLASAWQAAPALAPLLWVAQMAWLWKRSLRA